MGTGIKTVASHTASAPQLTSLSNAARAIPTTGMRGGLGRTLLTAFLMLTITPLALIGWYVVEQNRSNLQLEAANKLQLVATLKAENLEAWLWERVRVWRTLMEIASVTETAPSFSWAFLQQQVPELDGVIWTRGAVSQIWGRCAQPAALSAAPCVDILPEATDTLAPIVFTQGAETLVLCFDATALMRSLQLDLTLGQTGHIYLVRGGRVWLADQWVTATPALAPGTCVTLADAQPRSGWYRNALNIPVVGAYFPLAGLDIGVLVEQEQAEILASTEHIAATLIGGLLAVALLTTIISAFVIRQITRPVIRLTESALEMASGNLAQHVPVASRDEIGILTYVFNQMALELKSLYEDLEAKVVARTQLLQKANYQIQRRALQLEASLEVSQAITSIRDPEALLERVADRIRDRFSYVSVAVYLVAPGGAEARLHAASPAAAVWPAFVHTGDGTVVERALRRGRSQIVNEALEEGSEWYRRILSHVAIPLRMETRVLGVLAVRSAEHEGIQVDDLKVLEHLGNQVAIALENARAYERERLAAQQLEENEAFKARFLANMSHELRGPLNSILGFSRLMLKGFDGPLSEEQAADLQRIYANSQHLLGLINDILTISELRAGLLDLEFQTVDVRDLLMSVLPTASALIRGKEVVLIQQIPPQLPAIRGDPERIRQVLLHLLTNAAKFTHHGEITLRAWADEELVYVSIRDTGVGIHPKDRARIFAGFEKATADAAAPESEAGSPPLGQGVGLGLALCKEFVELHGGQIWLDSEVGKGSTFTFSLPIAVS